MSAVGKGSERRTSTSLAAFVACLDDTMDRKVLNTRIIIITSTAPFLELNTDASTMSFETKIESLLLFFPSYIYGKWPQDGVRC